MMITVDRKLFCFEQFIQGSFVIYIYFMAWNIIKEWQSDEKKERLIDVFLSMQDDMKAILDYFRIGYDKTELTSRELINKHI